jgi:RsiW-degrading membrane proteinase PrsW (M82 family)
VLPSLVIAAVSVAVAVGLRTVWIGSGSETDQAQRLAQLGQLAEAEMLYWQALAERPDDIETWIAFIDVHAARRNGVEALLAAPSERPPVSRGQVVQQLRRLEEPTRLLATFWYTVKVPDAGGNVREEMEAAAASDPPVRWANHLLGRQALESGDLETAAERFAREGGAFPEAQEDRRRALRLWARAGAWEELSARLDDPAYRDAVTPRLRVDMALERGQWGPVLVWLWPASFAGTTLGAVLLALVAGGLWFAFCARVGQIREASGRVVLYVAAFGLGVLSIYPTLLLATFEHVVFGFRPTGHPVADAIYYIFGVGLREELMKVVLFLPLLPALIRRRSRLEALTCGALVGLGFAAEENISYFQGMALGTALARFLTANFLHMALTALAAVALFDQARDPSARISADFNTVFPLVVLLHGVYDVFLASPQLAEYSFLAMAVFVLLSQRFLRRLLEARGRSDSGLFPQFVLSLVVLSGASYIYATVLIGPSLALVVLAQGLLGEAILVIMFARELQ